jgi:NAD(P)-dependent dehydrogenase (short-subunit alcohol dehydrogenase family)/acyl carrier protein
MASAVLSTLDLESRILGIFAEVTRYPLEIFRPDSDLEEDLGIDSVKLGEVFSVLRERYGLPEKMDIAREKLRTVAGISEALRQYLDQGTPAHPEPPRAMTEAPASAPPPAPARIPETSAAPVREKAPPQPVDHPVLSHEEPRPISAEPTNGHARRSGLLAEIIEIFAQVTRYPMNILEPQSDFDEDLGIDAEKVDEILAVVRRKYSLAATAIPREKVRRISDIAEEVREYLARAAAPPAVANQVRAAAASASDSSSRTRTSTVLHAERKPFTGKVALISGSGRALGKDVACYLAELGASVIVNSFHSLQQGEETVAQIKAAGGEAIHAWGSVANPAHVNSIFETVEKNFGGLDFFISNASNGMLARLEDITLEHWEKAFRTNVVGLHQCSLRAVELMKRRGGGKIITLSSPASHGYVDYFGCMGTVKAAVESLTKSMAIEFAPYNIQVNCVSPGPIYGDLLNKWPESKRLISEWENATVCDRLCENRDVSHFIAYLLGDAVKLFTGSVLVMDGGISVRWG